MIEDHDTHQLVHSAVLGKQIENFLASDIGNYIISRIDSEIAIGYQELRDAPCSSANAIMMAQNKVIRGEQMKDWLVEAIQSGLAATEVLESREDD